MNSKKIYTEPKAEVIRFDAEDVITTSGNDLITDNGEFDI